MKRIFLGLIGIVFLASFLLSCGASKKCDCPGFGQVESKENIPS